MRDLRFVRLGIVLLVACGADRVDPGHGPGPGTSAIQSELHRLVPSARPGVGAIVYPGGTTFRVWAPNADQLFVTGEFNGWSATANELFSEHNGNFSADVDGANAGQQYKYVIHHAGAVLYKADPRARRMTNSVGNSIIVDPGSYFFKNSFGTPSFNEQVVYELHIGSFNKTPGGPQGTFAGAINRLDHLQQLGINMIELMPVAEFPGDVSSGYNPSFPFAPESAYGPPDDLRRFVDEAHGRGIGVIMDVVHNHYGPNDLSMWCFDGECYGVGGIYFYNDWRAQTMWGPRPDYGRQQVRDYIQDNCRMWLDEYHMDGLRWDSTVSVRQQGTADIADGWALMQTVNYAVSVAMPWKIKIAEDFRDNAFITLPTFSGGAGFDSQWDGGFFHPVADAIITQNDADRSMGAVAGAISHEYNGQATQRVIYTESHDEDSNGRQRPPEMIWPGHADSYFSKKRSTLGAAIAMTSPGIPMLFMGQEFLESGFYAADRPLDWTKDGTFAGIKQLYTDLIHLRRNWYNNTRGLRGDHVNVFHINDGDKILAYHRWAVGGPGDDVVVVANFASKGYRAYHIGFPQAGTWYVRFNSDWNGYSGDFGNTYSYDTVAGGGGADGLNWSADVGIGAYSVIILSQ